jgi:hypothetical protein
VHKQKHRMDDIHKNGDGINEAKQISINKQRKLDTGMGMKRYDK